MSFFRRPRIHERTEARVEFLGEQDGDPERDLKARLSSTFAKLPTVRRAYLARVGFQPSNTPAVALCVASDAPDIAILEEAHREFAALFAADAFLDMFFVSAEQESDVARVCSPFYDRAV